MRTNFSKLPKEIRLKIAAKIGVDGQRALGISPGRLAVDESLYTGCHSKPVIQQHMLDSDDGIDDYTSLHEVYNDAVLWMRSTYYRTNDCGCQAWETVMALRFYPNLREYSECSTSDNCSCALAQSYG